MSMIYLAKQSHYGGDSILGAAYSEAGAKRIVEQVIRGWKDWGEIVWRADLTSWEDDDETQDYLRRVGRRIWFVEDDPDYSVSIITHVEA
jgi:hypothetical protein